MVLKIFKAMWFLSMMAVLTNLLYIYASLPEEVVIREETGGRILLNREGFFYIALGALALTNVFVYLVSKVFKNDEDFRAWFHGLVITLNIFFVVAFSLIGLYNSAENFNYSQIGFAIYGSFILFVGWAMSWPIYKIFKVLTAKRIV